MRKILLVLAATATSALLALGGSAVGARAGSPSPPRRSTVAVTAAAVKAPAPPDPPLEIPDPPPSGPFVVGTIEMTATDPDRPAPPRGAAPATDGRAVVTTVFFPVRSEPSAAEPESRPAVGPFPLIVFAHGFAIDAAAYAPLLGDLAAAGYVVAAPDFPGTSTRYPGVPDRSDMVQQSGDVSFVITSLLDLALRPGPLSGLVDAEAIGVAGQSDGGVTAAAASLNGNHLDPRIKASAILSGGTFGFDGPWFPPGTPPVLFVHATGDEVNPYGASFSMFARAQSPKYLMTIPGASHLQVFVEDPWEDSVAAVMTAFFALHLKGETAAADRLTAVAAAAGASLQVG